MNPFEYFSLFDFVLIVALGLVFLASMLDEIEH